MKFTHPLISSSEQTDLGTGSGSGMI